MAFCRSRRSAPALARHRRIRVPEIVHPHRLASDAGLRRAGGRLSLLVEEPDWVTKLDTAWIGFWSPGYALRANAERVSPWAADAQSRRRLPVRMELVLTSLSPRGDPELRLTRTR